MRTKPLLAIAGLALVLVLSPFLLRRDEPADGGCGPAIGLLHQRYQAARSYQDVVILRQTRRTGTPIAAQFHTTFVRKPRPTLEMRSLDGKSTLTMTALNDEDTVLKVRSPSFNDESTLNRRRAFARASGFTQGASFFVARLLMGDRNHNVLNENEPCQATKNGKGTRYLFSHRDYEVTVGPTGYIDTVRSLYLGETYEFTERIVK